MKKNLLYLLSFSLIITFTACKKDAGTDNNNTIPEPAQHADDQSRFAQEIDAVAYDADLAIETSGSSFTGRLHGVLGALSCDANAVINTTSNPMTITITYDSSNCLGNRVRSGVVVLSMAQGTQWKNAGAAITITFQNLKIRRLSDNKSITINGTQTYTNVSGGLLINLATVNNITHAITSNGLSVTFDNGSQRTWQVSKQRVFTLSNAQVVITTTGTYNNGNASNIAEWGTNRFGAAFTSAITHPLVIRQDCNFRLTSGAVHHTAPLFSASVTFGLNASGAPTSCPGAGNYYYKAIWTGPGGDSLTVIAPY